VLLLGGRPKIASFSDLAPSLKRVRCVVAYGEAAPIIERDLASTARVERALGRDFEAVLGRARKLAQSGDAVLLAPGCTSFDMFNNAEERGERFRAIVEGW
jgi:UDP-N-acetylmuramoylalanine--D-glutamate ligase